MQAAGIVRLSPWAFEDQSTWKKWRGLSLEIWESAQYSAQGARAHPVRMVREFQYPGAGALSYWLLQKKVAACTNNKDVFLCILRHYVREGHLQYLQKLQSDLAGDDDIEPEEIAASRAEDWLARNDSISCELGIRYPVLQAIFSGRKNHQTLTVTHKIQ